MRRWLFVPPFRVPMLDGFEDLTDYTFGTDDEPEGHAWTIVVGDEIEGSLDEAVERLAAFMEDDGVVVRQSLRGPLEVGGARVRCARLEVDLEERPFVWEIVDAVLPSGQPVRTTETLDPEAPDDWVMRWTAMGAREAPSGWPGWTVAGVAFDVPVGWRTPARVHLLDERDISVVLRAARVPDLDPAERILLEEHRVPSTDATEADAFQRRGATKIVGGALPRALAVEVFVRHGASDLALVGGLSAPVEHGPELRAIAEELAAAATEEGGRA